MVLGLLNVGPLELLIVAAAAVMLFGGDLPETARKAARLVVKLRGLAAELGREFSTSTGAPRPFRTADELRRLAGLDDLGKLPSAASADAPRGDGAPPPATPRDASSAGAAPDHPTWRPQTLSPPPELVRSTGVDSPRAAEDAAAESSNPAVGQASAADAAGGPRPPGGPTTPQAGSASAGSASAG